MTIASEIAAMLEREMEPAQGDQTFTFQGASYPCSTSTEEAGTDYEVGGKFNTVRLTLFVRINALPPAITVDSTIVTVDSDVLTVDDAANPPRSGQIITHRNRNYRLLSVTADHSRSAFYRLRLGDPTSAR